jgi:hypothetical protein
MPGCNLPKSEEFFVNKLVGRRYDPDTGLVKYLVSYEGYVAHICCLFNRSLNCT